jgi:hypothetical protein
MNMTKMYPVVCNCKCDLPKGRYKGGTICHMHTQLDTSCSTVAAQSYSVVMLSLACKDKYFCLDVIN